MGDLDAIIVGAGQAGLAVSHELTGAGVEHVVLERDKIGEAWRRRWDSFCLVTPNWSVRLPGYPYDGDDPDGFMLRDEIVAYLGRYAASFEAPVQEQVEVRSAAKGSSGFTLDTSVGPFRAPTLIVATGAYQKPHRPAGAASLPDHLLQIDVDGFQNAPSLPPGDVLIVGSGQSGCQIAEELHQAGRRVVLACGRAPWAPRRIGGRDLVWWIAESGFLDARSDSLPGPEARLFANILATGHDGGHDLHLRSLSRMGVTLVGHFVGAEGNTARFAPDLGASIAWGDERCRQVLGMAKGVAERDGLEVPEMVEPEPLAISAPTELDLAGFSTVLFAGGFRPDYSSWLPWPDAFDADGFPQQKDGASTVIEGLFFIGVHFLRKRKSSLLLGVGEDAEIVGRAVAGRLGR